MHAHATRSPYPDRGRGVVVYGYGIKIRVERGHLIIEDGIASDRRTRVYRRATAKLERLILIAHTGFVTLDSLRWLRDVDAAVVHVDADGRLLTTSAAAGRDTRSYAAPRHTPPPARSASRSVASCCTPRSPARPRCSPTCPAATGPRSNSTPRCARSKPRPTRGCSSQPRHALPPRTGRRGRPSRSGTPGVTPNASPSIGACSGQRTSLLTNGPRNASNPPNAILNYLYALTETEAILACHVVGLDPAHGVVHADQRSRGSLALDAIEAVRPLADAHTLALVTQRALPH
jgi:hypothetical protein